MARRLACLWMLLAADLVSAQDVLAWKWAPGDVVRMQYHQVSQIALAGQASRGETSWRLRFEPIGARGPNALLKMTVESVEAAEERLKAVAGAFKEASLTLELSATGVVQAIEGYDAFLDSASNKDADRRATLRTLYAPEVWQRAFSELFGFLPPRAVKVGEMWELKTVDPAPLLGVLHTTTRFKYLGDGDISASQAIVFVPGVKPDPLLGAKLELKTDSEKARYRFDRAAGRLVEAEKSFVLRGTWTPTVGKAEPVELRLESTVRMKVVGK